MKVYMVYGIYTGSGGGYIPTACIGAWPQLKRE